MKRPGFFWRLMERLFDWIMAGEHEPSKYYRGECRCGACMRKKEKKGGD